MDKYRGKADYTQEHINMIVGCGFDQTTERLADQLQDIAQTLHRIENELSIIRDISFTCSQLNGHLYDIEKASQGALKEILFVVHDLIEQKLKQTETECGKNEAA